MKQKRWTRARARTQFRGIRREVDDELLRFMLEDGIVTDPEIGRICGLLAAAGLALDKAIAELG